MDGMPRCHGAEGIHDPLFCKVMVILQEGKEEQKAVICSNDVCAVDPEDAMFIRKDISNKLSIPIRNIIISATHTHSGPATFGAFNPKAEKYVTDIFKPRVIEAISEAYRTAKPAFIGYSSGCEDTVSHYRRLKTTDGKIIMNWEPYPAEKIIGPAGEMDPQVIVIKVVETENPETTLGVLFNHAGHPCILPGTSFQISADYPGKASDVIRKTMGGIAVFLNAAGGSVDIDGIKDRDFPGVERAGQALGNEVIKVAKRIKPMNHDGKIAVSSIQFEIPYREITTEELEWAEKIKENGSGELKTLADGVGDEYVANLFLKLHEKKGTFIPIEMIGVAIGELAVISFPGEIFTEIGLSLKKKSPFKYTVINDLANGRNGYFPTDKAIGEGGYAVRTRRCGSGAEGKIKEQSLDLLNRLYGQVAS